MSAPFFGKTGMLRKRFDDLMCNLVWSEQPEVRTNDMSHKKYRWILADGFVNKIDDYRDMYFTPSDIICVDGSISIWYGKGGHWINHRLPMYVVINRNPENVYEIKNTCCGRSTNMMRLKILKTSEE